MKINAFQNNLKEIRRRSSIYLYGKLFFFMLALSLIILGVFYIKSNYFMYGGGFLFLLYLSMVYFDNMEMEREEKLSRILRKLQDELQNLDGIYTSYNGERYKSIQHPFTFDIDIFGENSLYHSINRTVTYEGSDMLAHFLSNVGIGKDIIEKRQEALKELEDLIDYRIEHISLPKVKMSFRHQLSDAKPLTINRNILKCGIIFSWSMIGSGLVFLLGCLILNYSIIIPVFTIAGVLLLNSFISILYFHKGYAIIHRLKFLITISKSYKPIITLNCTHIFKSAILKDVQKVLKQQKRLLNELDSMNDVLNFRNNFIFWIISNTLFVTDMWIIHRFVNQEHNMLGELSSLLENIGLLDALISLATFNFNHPDASTPIMKEDGLISDGIYHPLIVSKKNVSNNYKQPISTISIITGANMSGKSTFLRTIALNIVLANAGCKVCANSFVFNPDIKLFTSMRTQDDISTGKSYFNAEIERLNIAIDYCSKFSCTLLILDEVLKGTNSEDKLKGSLELLKFFSSRKMTVIIATHDLGVTKLEKECGENIFKNYCFEIELGRPINYNYQISRGICKNKNASFIISEMLKSK